MMEGIMGEMIVRLIMCMMEKKCVNELNPHDMHACPQLDTCHVGSYFDPLVPNFRTYDKIIIHTLCFKKY
jgi:hypothetical protein